MFRGNRDQVGVFDRPRRGSNRRGGALRHDDIAVGWLVETVQDHIVEATIERHHDARRRHLGDRYACLGSDFCRPGTRRVNNQVGAYGFGPAGAIILDLDTRHALARTDDVGDFGISANGGTVQARRREEGKTKAERLEYTIRDLHSSKGLRVEERFYVERVPGRDLARGDATGHTAFQ